MHGGAGYDVKTTPPDGGWGWVVVFASFMIHVIVDGVAYTIGIFVGEIAAEFQSGLGVAAGVASVMLGMSYLTGPLAGAFVNNWGPRRVSAVGSFLASLGFGLSYLVQHVAHLYITVGVLGGFGFGLIYVPAIVSVSCYFEKKRAIATGIAVCGSGIGGFAFPPLMHWLIFQYGWRLSLVITSGILVPCFFFSLLFKPVPDPDPPVEPSSNKSSVISFYRTRTAEKECSRDQFLFPTLTSSGYVEIEPRVLVRPIPLLPKATKRFESRPHAEALATSASYPVLLATLADQPVLRRHSLKGLLPFNSSMQLVTNRQHSSYSAALTSLDQNGKPDRVRRPCCSLPDFLSALKPTMDFSILKLPLFMFFAMSNLLFSIGYNVPFIYITDLAVAGNKDSATSYLLSIIGLSNTLSRILLGYLCDKPWVNWLYVYNVSWILSGIATGITSHITDIIWLRVYAAFFGVTSASFISLTSVVLVDLLGPTKLSSASGLLLPLRGVGALVGPPIVGKLYDEFHDYRFGFWLVGGLMALSGLLLFFITCFPKVTKVGEIG